MIAKIRFSLLKIQDNGNLVQTTHKRGGWQAGERERLMETLDIQITEVGEDFIRGTMPVDHRTVQPYGILHGGASVALAETLGSIAAHLVVVDSDELYFTVGMEVNANHLRPVTRRQSDRHRAPHTHR